MPASKLYIDPPSAFFAPHEVDDTGELIGGEIDSDGLYKNRYLAARIDIDYRDSLKPDVDFERCTQLFEATSRPKSDGDAPHRNMMRRHVEDFMSLTVGTVPACELQLTMAHNVPMNKAQENIWINYALEASQNNNRLVTAIKFENDYDDELISALRQSHVYGVGYIMVYTDESADATMSPQLQSLFNVLNFRAWSEQEFALWQALRRRVAIKHVDSRDVYWQAGARKPDYPYMRRVTVAHQFDTEALRRRYGNNDIMPDSGSRLGQPMPYTFNSYSGRVSYTTTLTTYEIEPTPVEFQGMVVGYESIMTRTVIGGGQLLEAQLISPREGHCRIPVCPLYISRSDQHPYGYSNVLRLDYMEQYYNHMMAMTYQRSEKSLKSGKAFIMVPATGEGDFERIAQAVDDPDQTIVPIYADQYPGRSTRITDLVQSLNAVVPATDPMYNIMMEKIEQMFRSDGNQADMEAFRSARTGAAKRAQSAIEDRPKTFSIAAMAKHVEDIHDMIYGNIVYVYTMDTVHVVMNLDGSLEQVRFNQQITESVPLTSEDGKPFFDEDFVDESNPDGMVTTPFPVIRNFVAIGMKSLAEGRGFVPIDPRAKIDFAAQMDAFLIGMGTGRGLHANTKRRFLPRELQAADQRNWDEEERKHAAMQQMQQQQELNTAAANMMAGPDGQAPAPGTLPQRSAGSLPAGPMQKPDQLGINGEDMARDMANRAGTQARSVTG